MGTKLTVKGIQHQVWADMVQQQVKSGLTVREWCEQNNITIKTFYYRRKHVREELLSANSPVFAELVPPVQSIHEVSDIIPGSGLTVTVNGATINVDQKTPMHLFKDVFQVIRDA